MGWNQTYSEKDVQIWTDKMTNADRDSQTQTQTQS